MPLTGKEKMRRYREKLKNENPEKYEEQRRKNLARIRSRKKKIAEMTQSEAEKKRNEWRKGKRISRQRQKQIKASDSPGNIDIEESSLFETEELETQTSKRNQDTMIIDYLEDDNGEDSNQYVDPLIPASHHAIPNRSVIKTEFSETVIPDTEETEPQNTCDDEFRIYGEYVASQLKQLSVEESLLARDKIQSILTQSRLRDLNRKKCNMCKK